MQSSVKGQRFAHLLNGVVIYECVSLQGKPGRPCPWLRSVHTCRRLSDCGCSTPLTTPTTNTGLVGGSSWRRAPKPKHLKLLQASAFPTTSPTCSRTSSKAHPPSLTPPATQTPRVFQAHQKQRLSATTLPCTQPHPSWGQSIRCTSRLVSPALQAPGLSRGSLSTPQGPPWSSTWSRCSWTCCMIWTAASSNSTWGPVLTKENRAAAKKQVLCCEPSLVYLFKLFQHVASGILYFCLWYFCFSVILWSINNSKLTSDSHFLTDN